MTLKVLYAGDARQWPVYAAPLTRAIRDHGFAADVSPDVPASEADYVVYAPNGPVSDFRAFTRAKAILSLWAGVEKIVGNQSLTQPLTRMVDSGLEESMVEYVTGHVLRYHLGMDRYILDRTPRWEQIVPPLARDRTVAVLGLGELGGACARALAALRFRVLGWSRRLRDLDGVGTDAGDDGLDRVLRQAQIVVLLLPATPATENLLDACRLALLPRGAFVINPGRGTLIDDAALVAAVDSGQVAGATLDVFRTEPLPAGHPFWSRPQITITPHIASETRPETASRVIAENIRRCEAGEPLLYLVDRNAGY